MVYENRNNDTLKPCFYLIRITNINFNKILHQFNGIDFDFEETLKLFYKIKLRASSLHAVLEENYNKNQQCSKYGLKKVNYHLYELTRPDPRQIFVGNKNSYKIE
jgi:hypothetical protein